jgi:acetylglutamate kinase
VKLLIKLGGTLLDSGESRSSIARQLSDLAQDHRVAVVHGGGKRLSRYLAAQGISSTFIRGFRVTTPETLDAVIKVLAGEVNLQLVAALQQAGVRAVGLTGVDGGLVEAAPLSEELGAVGAIQRARAELLDLLTAQGYLPVVACLAGGARGEIYNVNADQMAVACAIHFRAERLIFLTDVEGVLDAERKLIPELTADQADELIHRGVASGGMEAKLRACCSAIRQGVAEVRIANGNLPDALGRVLAGSPLGTSVCAASLAAS